MAAVVEGVLGDHADLETNLAFVPLDRALRDDGRLARLAQAHQEIDDRLRQVRRAVTCAEARRLLRAALDASRDHFRDEERSLFPAIERALKAKDLIALGESFQRSRRVAARPDKQAVLVAR
jgi:hemerythrin-like domain-containing protein